MYNTIKRKFACTQCGTPYEAYPPDDVHVKASSNSCIFCGNSGLKQVQVNYECENCNLLNSIFWHDPIEHTVVEKKMALYRIQNSTTNWK